jgi:hypothetical protein
MTSRARCSAAVLVDSGGRPATCDELVAFVAEQNARYAREHGGE